VWIGRCLSACVEETILVEDWWFESDTVHQGLDERNTLSVDADGGNLIFRVNTIEVGRVTDNVLQAGDIGLFVETLGQGGVHVEFDNFTVAPLSQ
jgi:hypothetical protein